MRIIKTKIRTSAKAVEKKSQKKKPAARKSTPVKASKQSAVAGKPAARAQSLTAKRKIASKKQPAPVTLEKPAAAPVTQEQRFRLIQEKAYFIAQKDGFKAHPDAYWWAAEAAVNVLLGTVEESGDGAKI